MLSNMPSTDQGLQLHLVQELEDQIKTLGFIWASQPKEFRIKRPDFESSKNAKCAVLVDIAHLFNPLGMMAPVTVMIKILLQKLWSLKI